MTADRILTIPAADRKNLSASHRWLHKAEVYGQWLRWPDDDLTVEPETIWMLRKGTNVRFYAAGRGQIGEQHKSVLAAACWAWSHGYLWVDEAQVFETYAGPEFGRWLAWQYQCRHWVLAGGAGATDHFGDQGVVVALVEAPS